ncbi:MAG: hypothetical protein ACLP29_10120 [Dissulfurispiraceae bacterium]
MKVKKIKIGARTLKDSLDNFVHKAKAVRRGDKVIVQKGTYFEDFEAIRKALTPKRLELIHTIKPLMCKRDIKNVSNDVLFLRASALQIVPQKTIKTAPIIPYDRISLEIAV